MRVVWTVLIVIAALFLLTMLIYWFNLDTKLVKALEKVMNKHYDNLKRDRKI